MSKQAMELAINALELTVSMNAARAFGGAIVAADEQLPFVAKSMCAIAALKEAIKQQDAETVARIVRNSSGQIYLVGSDGEYFDMSKFIWKLLYPTPQPPKDSQC